MVIAYGNTLRREIIWDILRISFIGKKDLNI
jgi:hypothetical protein